jgi:pimeloyl-ACP methyl ester carboxylesterase
MVPLSIGVRMSRDIPEATFAVITESGHIPQEEKPTETLRLIVDFLDRT